MIPKPFSRIAIAIDAPYSIPAGTPTNALEPHRKAVQEAVMSLMQDSQEYLHPGRKEAA